MTPKAFYEKYGFKLTESETFRNEEQGITPVIQKILEKELVKVRRKEKGTVKRLRILIQKYPKVPQFKNYLSAAYELIGKPEKAFELNRKILEAHPNYLFAKVNLAKEYIYRKNHEQALSVLGAQLSITEAFPNEHTFHVNEVINYYEAVFLYYLIGLKDDKKAQETLSIMEDAADDHPKTHQCSVKLVAFRSERFQKKGQFRKYLEERKYDKSVQTTTPPEFHFSEIEQLYQFGLRIDHSILREILALPREPLIEDLEKVLKDGLHRYEYWKKHSDESEEWDESLYGFPLHAIYLLWDLNSEDSLPAIWDFLRQGNEFTEFWLGDHLTEGIWRVFYRLGSNQLDLLRDYILEDDVYEFSKSPIDQALVQIALHQPERKPEVTDWFKSVLEAFIEKDKREEAVDIDTVGSVIAETMDIGAKELLPQIREVFERDMVATGICGDYEYVSETLLKGEEKDYWKKDLEADIFEWYNNILNTWAGYRPKKETPKINRFVTPKDIMSALPKRTSSAPQKPILNKKVGRNEPCICGSGKKYKKCCMRKYA